MGILCSGCWATLAWTKNMKGAGVGRIKVVLEMIPRMIFKGDLQ